MSTLPENVTVVRRRVKHARLRVSETGNVVLIVPEHLPQTDVESIYSGKKAWVADKLAYFTSRTADVTVTSPYPRTLLLHGELYSFYFESRLGKRTLVNHDKKVISSARDLADSSIRGDWYRKYSRQYFRRRAAELAEKSGYTFNRVYVRNQTTKWGNCSRLRNISLNWKLIAAPEYVSDYVILHELLHTVIPKHDNAFWARMRSLCPDYQRAVAYLVQQSADFFPDSRVAP